MGYRSRYICGTARMIADGEVKLDELKNMDYPEARAELMKLPGIGGKVAGLHLSVCPASDGCLSGGYAHPEGAGHEVRREVPV